MKPKAPSEHEDGLLEYLEDIIGTSRFKEPIDEALVKLDAFADERTEKLNRLRLVEREKNALEEKKKEAEDFLRLQNELVRARSRLYQWHVWQCQENATHWGDQKVCVFLLFFSHHSADGFLCWLADAAGDGT